MSEMVEVRRELRPGDLGEIVRLHAELYLDEFGLDPKFERHVAASVARSASRGWPERGGAWIVERDGEFAGSLALTDEGDRRAALRWFLLHPALRGRGLGRRLVGELVAEAESRGFEVVYLETLGILKAAAAIYRDHGFVVVEERQGPPWGDPEITYQSYELLLPRGRGGDRVRALAGSA